MRRRTSASCELAISGEISSAKLAISRSVSSTRTSGGRATASWKISLIVATLKDYSLLTVSDKENWVYGSESRSPIDQQHPTHNEAHTRTRCESKWYGWIERAPLRPSGGAPAAIIALAY